MLLLARLTVAAHELVHTSGCVDELRLTGVEGVRGAGDFQLHYGIGLTFEFYSVSSFASGTRKEHIAIAHILKYDRTIVLGMDSFFHFCYSFVGYLYLIVW